jgi:hypothetical protein
MIFLSLILKPKINRILNISIAGFLLYLHSLLVFHPFQDGEFFVMLAFWRVLLHYSLFGKRGLGKESADFVIEIPFCIF